MTSEPIHAGPNASTAGTHLTRPARSGRVFGLPLGDFGLFASLLIAFSSGFVAFFLTTFFAIFGILFYNTLGHHSMDFAIAYKRIAFPVGIVVLAVSLLFFGTVWVRRKLSGD
ncbi:MAG TPA: hypothetical protein VM554_10000 [Acidisarcina sp.]|nr:hypothetical protein [Acidisarcina sp.]